MGLIDRLLGGRSRVARRAEEREKPAEEKTTVSREELGTLRNDESAQQRSGAGHGGAAPGASTVADAALREALNAVQGVVDKARSYVTEIGGLQERKAEPTAPRQPEASVPAAQATGALMTEASATVLIEYLKHFFDLVSMQNRLLERRLDSLETLLSRLDQHVTEDAAEVSARLSTLEGVQLPLVKPAAAAEPSGAARKASAEDDVPSLYEKTTPEPASFEEPEAASVPRTYQELVANATESDEPDIQSPAPSYEEAAVVPAPGGGEVEFGRQPYQAPAEGPGGREQPQFEDVARSYEEPPAPADDEPEAASATTSLGDPESVGLPAEIEEPVAGTGGEQPVLGVLRLEGLESFRALFAIRDELRRREDVLNADAASFEAGHGELRVKATRVIGDNEMAAALSEATGQDFAATGPMSFTAAPRGSASG